MIGPIQSSCSQTQADPAANPAQRPNQPAPSTMPQDTVTISAAARQAQGANNQSAPVAGDADHDGDSH